MRCFTCRRCGQLVFFENFACLRCGAPLGVVPAARELATLTATGGGAFTAFTSSAGVAGERYRRCADEAVAGCNWLVVDDGAPGGRCRSGALTRTRPPDTFAHYLHIRDTLQTAAAYGMRVAVEGAGLASTPRPERDDDMGAIVAQWLPLTYALNAVNRSMGRDDLYPFVLAPTVVDKLAFVHRVAEAAW